MTLSCALYNLFGLMPCDESAASLTVLTFSEFGEICRKNGNTAGFSGPKQITNLRWLFSLYTTCATVDTQRALLQVCIQFACYGKLYPAAQHFIAVVIPGQL
jgi:hypothetical protein